MKSQIRFFIALLVLAMVQACKPEVPPKPTPYDAFCECEYEHRGQTLELGSPRWQEANVFHQLIEKTNLPLGSYPFKLCRSKTNIKDAAAFATEFNGYPYIIYDPASIGPELVIEIPPFAIFLMGHELGHVLLWHYPVKSNDDVVEELEADEFAGAGLFLMGVSLQDAIDVFQEDKPANHPHSSGKDRRAAIKKGWLKAQANSSGQPTAYKPAPPQGLGKSKASMGGKKYSTMIVGDREIMTEDMMYSIGNSRGGYYSITEAHKACEANGWELMRDDDYNLIIKLFDESGVGEQGFDATRAYGALLVNGSSGFNASLRGYADEDYEGKLKFIERGISGKYWIQEHSTNGHPKYFDFDKKKGTLVRYWTDNYSHKYACRCARDIN